MKIITIIGARPQFIKAFSVSRAFKHYDFDEVIVHTGQHYDENMSQIFFDEMGIPTPKYNLGVGGGNHGKQTGLMLQKIEEVLLKEQPDWVVVYGDTNSTLAGALAAAKLHMPVAHIEAGLRSFNRKMPEEINRVLTDHLSDLLFATSEVAVSNLKKEGIDGKKVINVGDVMHDAVLYFSQVSGKPPKFENYILATIHRAENTDNAERLKCIFEALIELSKHNTVILPLHPRTKKALNAMNMFSRVAANIHFLEPQGFINMINLEKHATLIVTDSGGIQKEAYYLRKPCVTLRDETEWVELVKIGWNKLVPPLNKEDIYKSIEEFIRFLPKAAPSIYGDGDAGMKIADYIKSNEF